MTNIYIETERGRFSSADGYDGISDDDLGSLFASLSLEIEKRVLKTAAKEWEETLRRNSKRLQVRQRLEKSDLKNINFIQGLIGKLNQSRQNEAYLNFIVDVVRFCHNGFALLCIISFGQNFFGHLKEEERISLLEYLKDSQDSFSNPVLETFATQYRIGQIAGM
jgi:hypothetical protein